MNKIYRLVWNAALRLWQVSAELTRSHRKRGRSNKVRSTGAVLLLFVPLTALGSELPTNGVISAGSGAITQTGATMTISQQSERMVLDWQSFSIGEGATVRFVQPGANSAALNRVLGTEVSKILGSLEANGQVFLVNPNGVLFGAKSEVNVGGLVASTLDIASEDFLAGNLRFEGTSDRAVINHGKLTAADGGYIALIAARVENAGDIGAVNGDVVLGAGRKVRLDLGGPVKLEIDAAALDALIEQRGAIRADGGRVLLTASAAASLASTVINHSGIIEARSLATTESGEIVLSGSGGAVEVNGALNVASVTAEGGRVTVTGDTVRLHEDARIDASGNSAGGAIYVGGGWQGKDSSIANAASTEVAAGALLDASATGAGDGGTVVVWANDETRYAGSIAARGAQGGAGGRVEVSGKRTLAFDGAVDTGGGTLLLDPASITIQASSGNLNDTFGVAQLRTLLESNDVDLLADDTITWNSDATLDYDGLGTARTLTLRTTDGDISFNGWVRDSIAGDDALSVVLDAGGSGTLYFDAFARIEAGAGGNVDLRAGGHVQFDGLVQTWGSGDISVYSANADVELNKGVLQVQDGTISVDSHANIVSIWNSRYIVDRAGHIALTSRNGGIYIGGSSALSESYIRGGSGDITLTGNAITFQNVNTDLTGTGRLILQPNHPDMNVVIGNTSVAGALSLKAADFTNRIANTFSHITIGREDGAGAMTLGDVSFRTDTTLRAGGDIDVTGLLRTLGNNLTVNAGGSFGNSATGIVQTTGGDFNATIGSLDIAGGERFRASVDTYTGNLTISTQSAHLAFSGANLTTLGGNLTIDAGTGGATGARIELSDDTRLTTVNGDITLTQRDTNGATIIGTGALGSMIRSDGGNVTIQDAAQIRLDGDSGIYAYLGGDLHIAAPEITFGTTVDGTFVGTDARLTIASAGGRVSQAVGNTLEASDLLLIGASDFDFAGRNLIVTLAADIDGALTFRHFDGFTIGTVGATNGVRATGAIDISTQTGNLVVDAPIVTSDASSSAITLNAGRREAAGTSTGGNLIINAPNALSMGAGGRATLYTGSIANSTGVADFAVDGHARYGSDETIANYTAALGAGAYVIYREQPTLRYIAGNAGGSYGDTPDLSEVTHTIVSGYLGSDADFDTISSPGTFATAASATSNVGTYALTYSGAVYSALGYATEASGTGNGEYTVTPRVLNLSGSRAYDGSNSVNANALALGNLANGDMLTLSGAGLLANPNVGAGKTLTLGSLALGNGTGFASNYTLVGGTHAVDITPRALTLGGSFTVKERAYDGSTNATVDVNRLTLNGIVAGEDLALTGLAASFADPNAGDAKSVSLTAAALANGNAGLASNYTLSLAGAPTATGRITPRQVTLTGAFSVGGKIYDGSTVATLLDVSGLALSGVVAGEDLTVSGFAAEFADANAGKNKIVQLVAADLADGVNGLASNYAFNFDDSATTRADITPKNLIVRVGNHSAIYDGAVYDDGFSVVYDGLVAGEDASALSGSLSFTGAGRNVGAYTISATGLSSTNYAIDYVDGLLTIDPADLTISVRDVVKTYDATTRANGVAIAVDGTQLFGNDTLRGGTFAFLDARAGANKTVTVSNVTIDDGNGGANYKISYRDNTSSTIERAPLVISVDDVIMRYTGAPYSDGFSVIFEGFVGDEDVSVLEGELRFDGPATQAVKPGRYAIDASGLAATNYAIRYVPGTLHIEGKEDNVKVASAQHMAQAIAQHTVGGASNGSLATFGKAWNPDGAMAPSRSIGAEPYERDPIPSSDAEANDATDADQAHGDSRLRLFVIDGGIRLPF